MDSGASQIWGSIDQVRAYAVLASHSPGLGNSPCECRIPTCKPSCSYMLDPSVRSVQGCANSRIRF